MKIKIDKKYVQIGITIFLTAIAVLLVVFFIWNNQSIRNSLNKINKILSPVLYGLIIAYLLTPILNFYEKKMLVPLFHKLKWFEEEKDRKRDKHIRFFGINVFKFFPQRIGVRQVLVWLELVGNSCGCPTRIIIQVESWIGPA